MVGGFETTGTCNRANGIALPVSCTHAVAFIPKFGAMYKLKDEVTYMPDQRGET